MGRHGDLRAAGHRCQRYWQNGMTCPFRTKEEDQGNDEMDEGEARRVNRVGGLKAQDVMMAGVVERQQPQALGGEVSLIEQLKAVLAMPSSEELGRFSEVRGSQRSASGQRIGGTSVPVNLAQEIEKQLAAGFGHLSRSSENQRMERGGEKGAFNALGPTSVAAAVLSVRHALRTLVRAGKLRDVSRPRNVSTFRPPPVGVARSAGSKAVGGGGLFFQSPTFRPGGFRRKLEATGFSGQTSGDPPK